MFRLALRAARGAASLRTPRGGAGVPIPAGAASPLDRARPILGDYRADSGGKPPRTTPPAAARAGEDEDEHHLPTEPHATQADPRFPEAHVDEVRAQGTEGAPEAGPQAPLGLIAASPRSAMRGPRPRPEGFPKEERVRRTADYTRILRDGTRVRGRFLNAYWVREIEGDDAPNRVGVAAGKKLGNAVRRNRLKRRLREAYRRNKRELSCRGIAMVFVASSRMIGRGSREVEDDVIRVLRAVSESSA